MSMVTRISGCYQPYPNQCEEKHFMFPNILTVDCAKARYFYGEAGSLKSRKITGFNGVILFGKVYKLAELKDEAKKDKEVEQKLKKIIKRAEKEGIDLLVHTTADQWYELTSGVIVIGD